VDRRNGTRGETNLYILDDDTLAAVCYFRSDFDVAAGYREISADGANFMKLVANAIVVDVQINRTLLDSIVTEISLKINIARQGGLPGAKTWIGKLIPVVVLWKLVLVPATNVSDK
jgi:hypothetical protein